MSVADLFATVLEPAEADPNEEDERGRPNAVPAESLAGAWFRRAISEAALPPAISVRQQV